MYAPDQFRIDGADSLAQLKRIGFATIVVAGGRSPIVAHAPFVVTESGVAARIAFHLARPNAAVAAIAQAGEALLIATGPDHYISPDWYVSTDQVPTWNYVAVHAAGPVTALDEPGTRGHLDALSARFEADLRPKAPWTTAKMTPARLDAMLRGIVAFDMEVTSIDGVAKMSQNKRAEDAAGAADGLDKLGTARAVEVAHLMRT